MTTESQKEGMMHTHGNECDECGTPDADCVSRDTARRRPEPVTRRCLTCEEARVRLLNRLAATAAGCLRTLVETPRTHGRDGAFTPGPDGRPRVVTPRLVTRAFGDGRRLFAVRPWLTRPDYYVVRGDSTWRGDPRAAFADPGRPSPPCHEGVYAAVEEEFGRAAEWWQPACRRCTRTDCPECQAVRALWPALTDREGTVDEIDPEEL